MPAKKLFLAALIACIALLFLTGGGEKYLDIHLYQDLFERSPVMTVMVFFTVLLIGTSLSLPIAGVLSVASGIIFGTLTGFLISLSALTMGGAMALYITRYLFHDLVLRRFGAHIAVINKGLEKEGVFYLFSLRLVPVIPFWLINLVMGLTSMRVPVFMLATFCGMAPVILVLNYTGSELGDIDSFSVSSVFTPGLLFAFALLASFPFVARAILAASRGITRRRKA